MPCQIYPPSSGHGEHLLVHLLPGWAPPHVCSLWSQSPSKGKRQEIYLRLLRSANTQRWQRETRHKCDHVIIMWVIN